MLIIIKLNYMTLRTKKSLLAKTLLFNALFQCSSALDPLTGMSSLSSVGFLVELVPSVPFDHSIYLLYFLPNTHSLRLFRFFFFVRFRYSFPKFSSSFNPLTYFRRYLSNTSRCLVLRISDHHTRPQVFEHGGRRTSFHTRR